MQDTTTPSALGRKRDPEGTRALLVENAFREIHAHGYAGASLDRILASSGVTKGALYHHFKSKADLLHAVIDDAIRPMVVDESGTVYAAAGRQVLTSRDDGTSWELLAQDLPMVRAMIA
ncbi:MAG: helix-turn-helix transcriptional regulator [Gemmatimonadetes bacterium]|nr:helix-turn-helix transcriptional regulator [Gemmatimonadota bacterium]